MNRAGTAPEFAALYDCPRNHDSTASDHRATFDNGVVHYACPYRSSIRPEVRKHAKEQNDQRTPGRRCLLAIRPH